MPEKASGKESKKVSVETRVRYAETDQMGVAYYANFFVWFELGRAEYMRASGPRYADLEKQGLYLPVTEARCRYVSPAMYDDPIRVETRVEDIGHVRIKFGYQVFHAESGKRLAEGWTLHAALNPSGKPRRIPERIRRMLVG